MAEDRDAGQQHATLVLRTPQALRDLPASIAFPCRARARRQPDGSWHARVIAASADLDDLRHPELIEVRRTVPGPAPAPAPDGDYLSVDGIEGVLAGMAEQYRDVTTLITLPNKTSEGRTCHALRIGAHAGADHAVLFTACLHASEWGGAEIALGFASSLLHAYQTGTALNYGDWALPGVVVRRIIAELDVVVFPCVNPDGRHFSQQLAASGSARWTRKNRNQAATPLVQDGVKTDEIGVDVDRNFDWLWDFRRQFSAEAVSPASDKPQDVTFHGPARTSEAETRNVVWLFDQFPNLDRYLDIHSADGDVLYSWSDDTDQSVDPDQRFNNPTYSGERGVAGGYGEYVTSDDRAILQGSAEQVVAAINAVGLNPLGHEYTAIQSCTLWGDGDPDVVTYPTSGTVDDWAFALSTNVPGRRTVYPLVVEFNFDAVWHDPQNADFHPPWAAMEKIVVQINAGMAQLCALALPVEGDPGGGGGHQHPPLNEACYELSVKIGQVEGKIAQLQQDSPGPSSAVTALEKQLAALQTKFASQCHG